MMEEEKARYLRYSGTLKSAAWAVGSGWLSSDRRCNSTLGIQSHPSGPSTPMGQTAANHLLTSLTCATTPCTFSADPSDPVASFFPKKNQKIFKTQGWIFIFQVNHPYSKVLGYVDGLEHQQTSSNFVIGLVAIPLHGDAFHSTYKEPTGHLDQAPSRNFEQKGCGGCVAFGYWEKDFKNMR